MIRINDITDKVLDYNIDADIDFIRRAYVYSAQVHQGQTRLSGEPYLMHPLEVAGILADMKFDEVSIAAALLHDVIEDTWASDEDLKEMFGEEVHIIVAGVTKLSVLTFGSSQEREAENIRKMILAMADDIRVILIKLADRLHNMRTLHFHKSDEKKRKIAQETLDIYTPIAARLGIYWIKSELENIAFKYTMPNEFRRIKSMVNTDKEDRMEYVEEVKNLILDKMEKSGLGCEVFGRHKQYYSIFQKMVSQDLEFREIYDLTAFRVILESIPQCYEALGLIHSMWKPIPNKFKDYIGVPKPNMYQSLHTTMIGPYGERIEIQIRTKEMDRVAKSGIAAHWTYKEGSKADEKLNNQFTWIQNLLDTHQDYKDPKEFLENVKIDLFPDDVYVFTPQGEIKNMPKGACPVDFAYTIHTEVGNQCIGAKVNGRLVSLNHELQTGDIVEIMTRKGSHPSKDWINFVITVKARSRIRQWIKSQDTERSLDLGREMLDKTFKKKRLNFSTAIKSGEIDRVIEELGYKNIDSLITAVGYGKVTPLQVLGKFTQKPSTPEDQDKLLSKLMNRVAEKKKRITEDGVMVKGLDDILIRFGKCCSPVPGDSIIGYITIGQGVTVHRIGCKSALKMNPDRSVDVEWADGITESYPVTIEVKAMDRVGLLADLSLSISKNNANILSANTEIKSTSVSFCFFKITVDGTDRLDRVLNDIKKIRSIQEVKRVT